MENPLVTSNQKITSVGSHSHFAKPLKYSDSGKIKNTMRKIAYTKDIRIQIDKSENERMISPSLSVIEKSNSSLCKTSLIMPCV